MEYSNHSDAAGNEYIRCEINGNVYEIDQDYDYPAMAYKVTDSDGVHLRNGLPTIDDAKRYVAELTGNTAKPMSINIDRVYRIAKMAEVSIDKALEVLVDYDWTQDGVTKPGEHEVWFNESTDDAVCEWLWAVIDNDEVFG